jgi:hypothetical protein
MISTRRRVARGLAWALALALGACGARTTAGPKWPELHHRDDDGGESLAPREPTETAAALEEDPHPVATAPAEVSIAPVVTPPTPPAATTPPPEEAAPVQLEDTVIEIHDDE